MNRSEMIEMDAITITMPWPSSKLHSHNKGHWRNKNSEVARYRRYAEEETWIACNGDPPNWKRARKHYAFFVPDNRRRDPVNMMQSMKSAVDGIVDAGLWEDDCWQCTEIGRITVEIDRKNPRVELTFERIENE